MTIPRFLQKSVKPFPENGMNLCGNFAAKNTISSSEKKRPLAEQRSLEELPGPRGANGRKFPPILMALFFRGWHWGRHLFAY